MIRLLAPLPIALLCATAVAQVSGHAQTQCSGETAVLSVSASAAPTDTGRPGAWYIAAHHPIDATQVAFLTQTGWVIPESAGKLVPFGVYPDGIPGSISVTACAPQSVNFDSSCGSTTEAWAGYVIKVGYGVLTPQGEMLVSTRRDRLDAAKPVLQEQGKWKPEYEDDNRMREALVIKSMRENDRVGDVLIIPSIPCRS